MVRNKKTLHEEEEIAVERSIASHLPEGDMVNVTNYFDKLDRLDYPKNVFDVVIHRMEERPRYFLGAIASRSRDGLKPGGLLIIDYFGYVDNLDQLKVIIEFEGLQFKEHDKKNAVMVFVKPLTNEYPPVQLPEKEEDEV